jgi:hypothetical protein
VMVGCNGFHGWQMMFDDGQVNIPSMPSRHEAARRASRTIWCAAIFNEGGFHDSKFANGKVPFVA